MNRSSRCILFIGILMSAICQSYVSLAQTIGFTLKEGLNEVTIPFERYNNLIVVPVILNNAIPLRFLLDTGVQTTILTDRTFSDILDIQYHKKLTLLGADGDKGVDAHIAGNVTLELPGTRGEGQVMLVLEEDYLQLKHYLGEEVHGILGYEIFRRFIVKIDYRANTLTLYEPSMYKAPRRHAAIPITVEKTKPYFFADITLKNDSVVKAKLMIDTGASHSLLLDEGSHEAIYLPDQRIRCNLGRGLGGDINGYIARIKKISFDKFELEQAISSFPDTSRVGEVFRETGRQGTLGAGILRRFTVTIDYYNSKMYLKKNRAFKSSFDYNMSGIELVAKGRDLNVFVVQNLRENSPAERVGVLEGDTLRVVNGVAARDLNLNQINNLFRLRDGKKIRLRIERKGETIKKVFRLERVI